MNSPHSRFESPFGWRYGSAEMRRLWSEAEKHRLWRWMWVELARAEEACGLVTAEQRADLERAAEPVDMERIEAIEADIQHDLMAALRAFAEAAPVGGPILHLGATSADIEDNADALRIRASLGLIEARLAQVLRSLAGRAIELAREPVMAFTHLQPAEPTTAGYRLCLYLQDLWADWTAIRSLVQSVRGKGFKGAVGTRASYVALLEGTATTAEALDRSIMRALELNDFPVTSQTYPRRQDWEVLSALAGVAASLSKFAYDLRVLQSPLSGELAEPFGNHQVGSSAMPFKRNPISSEKIDSLGRLVASFVNVAWQNASLSFLERTLDDSASRREILPVAFLAVDEMLLCADRLARGMRFDRAAALTTFNRYAPFSATEPILMAAVRAGGDRQALHEYLREVSMQAYDVLRSTGDNPMLDFLVNSPVLLRWLTAEALQKLADPRTHLGDAPQRAQAFAETVLASLESSASES